MKRFILPLAGFATVLLLLGLGLRQKPDDLPSPFIGKPAPAFSLATLEPGKTFSPQDMRGRIWLLNAWASWCGTCKVELPALQALARDAAVPIVGLNYKDQMQDGQRWLQRHGNPFAVNALDAEGRVGIDYGIYGLPETFLIDQHGVIRLRHVGAITPEVVRDEFLPLIAELRRG